MSTVVAKSAKHDGIIIPSKNNAEMGSIMVIETKNTFEGGFVNTRKRVGLLKGKIEDLKNLGWREGQIVDLKVIYKESLDPFYDGQEPKIYPENHAKAGQIITFQGSPIYVNKLVVDKASAESDELLASDKEVETLNSKAAIAEQKTAAIKS